MLVHLKNIINEFDCVPKRLIGIMSQYIMFLMLTHKKHEVRTASRVFGIHETNYSRMLSQPKTRVIARSCLNRAIKRRLSRILRQSREVLLIVDATLSRRTGKKVGNRHKFRHGGPYVEGHQFTNFVLLIDDEIVPLCSVPFYSKAYCKEIGIAYRTEVEMVTDWIEMLPSSGLLPDEIICQLHFLLDTGYDAKSIQNAIQDLNAKFTVGLSSDRSVNGLSVSEYFRRNRQISWRTIRIKNGNCLEKRKERMFRVRTADKVHLKGFGEVNVVCSEKRSRIAGKTSRKFIATNDLRQSTRKTVKLYSKRWAIETWHKEVKQNHGFGDCRSKDFVAIETHINLVLCAYCLLGLSDPKLPKRGTPLHQYLSGREWQNAARVINLFDGRKKVKALAHQAINRVVNG